LTSSDEPAYSPLNLAGDPPPAMGTIGPHRARRTAPVPGKGALMAAGFEPIESLTGSTWIAEVWPDEHRRWLVETREAWLEQSTDSRVWFVRSPWQAIDAGQVISLIWANLAGAEQNWPTQAADLLRSAVPPRKPIRDR
jgi:hypothetical protein